MTTGMRRTATCSVEGAVLEHELYKKYRQLIEELANRRHSRDRWLTDLHTLLQRFARTCCWEPSKASMRCHFLWRSNDE